MSTNTSSIPSSSPPRPGKRVLVTVGTTEFPELLETITQPRSQEALVRLGFTQMTLQHGSTPLHHPDTTLLSLHAFPYTDDLEGEMAKVDLVVGHGGAGTILETMQQGLPLLVVINPQLADNHQAELVDALEARGCLSKTTCRDLPALLDSWSVLPQHQALAPSSSSSSSSSAPHPFAALLTHALCPPKHSE
ncbi:MAG: glycosyltransferase family 28 C-terminal domain-containing protein [Piptocephalis tieghemiana]|nr:MAG: glycosyltransferase family 28 C-terminal domain-containing protein [Piptocephalis tieghemiana]